MSLNIMVLGSEIIKYLNRDKQEFHFVETILEEFLKADKKRTPDLFVYSLLFLYSVGIIERQGYKIRLNKQTEEQQELFQ